MADLGDTNTFFNALAQRKNLLLTCCVAVIVLYFLPYILLAENSALTIRDNLDSNVVWVKLFLEHGDYFSVHATPVEQMMNGVSPASLYGSNDLGLVFFKLFGFYWGYVINKIIMALVAFFGMRLLLSNYFIAGEKHTLIRHSVALIFAILPFWSFTLSVAGMPLLLFAFLNIREKKYDYYNWLIILLMSFYSSLIFSGIFFMIITGSMFIYDAVRTKKINFVFLFANIALGIGYIASHYRLFYSFLIKTGYVTHRVEIEKETTNFAGALRSTGEIFSCGQYHAHSLHLFILFAVAICMYLMKKFNIWSKEYLWILAFIIMTSFFYGFLNWGALSSVFKAISAVLPIQLQRFHTLHPMFWYVLFAMSLVVIAGYLKKGRYVVVILLFLQFTFVLLNHELFANRKGPSYKAFYSEALFNDVKQFIGKDPAQYRVMSLGLHPAVSQYNGFYTLDGYAADYSLEYKHAFRKIIAGELDKNAGLKKYFDGWGSRCYGFSAELGKKFMYGKTENKRLEHLDFDVDAFHQLGGQYIISAVEINAENNKRYILRKTFENENAFWKIYLYEVI